jgi:16S rRNA (uracil1498-N3)-methyltransferase
MPRFYARPEELRGETLQLSREESRHAAQVLRLRVGDAVVVLTGEGEECHGEVSGVRNDAVSVRIVRRQTHARPAYRLRLLQAVPKGKAMDSIVQKATELGVDRIVPLLTERTVPDVGGAAAAAKRERWLGIAVESMKQCGTPWLPEIDEPTPIEAFAKRSDRMELSLVASLQPGAQHPRRCFEAFVRERGHLPGSVEVWIGPEGDFAPVELDRIIELGAMPITLGRLVLRSDTAAICALSVVQYEMGAVG